MGFREILEKLKGKSEDSDYIKELNKRMRAEEILLERRKSANQRELERDLKEEYEEDIKNKLGQMRKKRSRDINFGHNPLDTKNVVSHTEWEIMKEPSLFSNHKNMFVGQKNIFAPENNEVLF